MKQSIDILLATHEPHTPIGQLEYERLRGNAVYHFSFHPSWLQSHPSWALSGDLSLFLGQQHKSGQLFGCFQDALPDRWGRRLIDKREQILAKQEHRLARVLTDFDYLTLSDDFARVGALRFWDTQSEKFIGTEFADCSVPPLTTLPEFMRQAQSYELHADQLSFEWIDNLYRQGSSLGGARPKASVQDENGQLFIAKVPSIHDDYDIALWEHFACRLAHWAGVDVAESRVLSVPGFSHHALLSKRFDRQGKNRIHYASAMTLTNLTDGADAYSGNGYLDIVDVIIGNMGVAQQEKNLEELYRRVAFSICIGNSDDHFRNHAFLLTDDGWTLSPAFDLNPSNQLTQSLLISDSSNESSIDDLLRAAGSYFLSEEQAKRILSEVKAAMRQWRKVATACHISPAEQQRFASRLDLFI